MLMILPFVLPKHGLAEDLASPQRTVEIHVHYVLPQLFGAIEGRNAFGDAGGVDEDVDLAERGEDGVVKELREARSRTSEGMRRVLRPVASMSDGQRVYGFLRTRGGNDVGSWRCQTQGDGLPDAGGTADNNGAFPCKI